MNIEIGTNVPDIINVVVEIPANSKNKYEYDETLHHIKLDRVIHATEAYPCDYGFIPMTKSDDGDHLDAFIILENSVFPGCIVAVRPVGMIKVMDDGIKDKKIICVPANDDYYVKIKEIEDLSPKTPQAIENFLEHYKDSEHKKVEILGWADSAEAKQEIIQSEQSFRKE